MNYYAITKTSLKTKAGYWLRGISFGQLLVEVSPEMLAAFLSSLSARSVLFVSPDKILYEGIARDAVPVNSVIYIITPDAELVWERKLTTPIASTTEDIDLPF